VHTPQAVPLLVLLAVAAALAAVGAVGLRRRDVG
jgi:putative exporter of polyketide antibiotics